MLGFTSLVNSVRVPLGVNIALNAASPVRRRTGVCVCDAQSGVCVCV